MERTHPNLVTIRIEWQHDFDFVINPDDPTIMNFFTGKWKLGWKNDFFPPKTIWQELREATVAFLEIAQRAFKTKVLKR
jgi:hypothetical protein